MFQYVVGTLFITVEIPFQKIREKEEPEDGKHDKKLDQNDSPKFPAPGHLFEAFIIESENFLKHWVQYVQQIYKLKA